jgi:hypothetical protein
MPQVGPHMSDAQKAAVVNFVGVVREQGGSVGVRPCNRFSRGDAALDTR